MHAGAVGSVLWMFAKCKLENPSIRTQTVESDEERGFRR